MIQLTNEQAEQLHTNLSKMVDDLEEIINAEEDTPFWTIGGKAGLALQKAYDAQAFMLDLLIKASKNKSESEENKMPHEDEILEMVRKLYR